MKKSHNDLKMTRLQDDVRLLRREIIAIRKEQAHGKQRPDTAPIKYLSPSTVHIRSCKKNNIAGRKTIGSIRRLKLNVSGGSSQRAKITSDIISKQAFRIEQQNLLLQHIKQYYVRQVASIKSKTRLLEHQLRKLQRSLPIELQQRQSSLAIQNYYRQLLNAVDDL